MVIYTLMPIKKRVTLYSLFQNFKHLVLYFYISFILNPPKNEELSVKTRKLSA